MPAYFFIWFGIFFICRARRYFGIIQLAVEEAMTINAKLVSILLELIAQLIRNNILIGSGPDFLSEEDEEEEEEEEGHDLLKFYLTSRY